MKGSKWRPQRRETSFSRALDTAMRERSVSNAELGRALGVGPVAISRWRTGRAKPFNIDPATLARALGIQWPPVVLPNARDFAVLDFEVPS